MLNLHVILYCSNRIITLEDVLEALLQEQIYDEMDHAAGRMPVVHEMEPIEEAGDYRLAWFPVQYWLQSKAPKKE